MSKEVIIDVTDGTDTKHERAKYEYETRGILGSTRGTSERGNGTNDPNPFLTVVGAMTIVVLIILFIIAIASSQGCMKQQSFAAQVKPIAQSEPAQRTQESVQSSKDEDELEWLLDRIWPEEQGFWRNQYRLGLEETRLSQRPAYRENFLKKLDTLASSEGEVDRMMLELEKLLKQFSPEDQKHYRKYVRDELQKCEKDKRRQELKFWNEYLPEQLEEASAKKSA